VPAAVIGGIVVLGLLALGGAREQRRRSPRLHR
jgi:MYXO-CTERM domain-containing protein